MLKKSSIYWICQLAGWGMLFAMTMFFYFTLSIHKTDLKHFLPPVIVSVLMGIIFTHLMRMIILEYKFLEKTINRQIISFFVLTILFSFVYACADIAVSNAFHLQDEMERDMSLPKEITRDFFNNLFILFIWNLIYYAYHFIERIRRHEVDALKLQSLVKELELKTIKAHINPHFIFNSLNSIRALVDENPDRARRAITELSNILRSSMRAEKLETVPLKNELSIVRDYLALEHMRFEERLKIEMLIDDNTLDQPVPPMMLQILVENAIKHGISKRMSGGLVRVCSYLKDGVHELTVQNTGQLNGHFDDDGFGIRSTQDRLNILYHGKASFSLENLNNEMVQSKIIMPILN